MVGRSCWAKAPRLWRLTGLYAVLVFLVAAISGCGGSDTQTIFVAVTPTPTAIPTATPIPSPTPPSPFATTGSMTSPRTGHTATLLSNGEVLIAGGEDDSGHILASAELYSSKTGTFIATGSMNSPREFHAAALLAGGQVLITGGLNNSGAVISTAELYDPATGKFTLTTAAAPGSGTNMVVAREFQTATTLTNGQVLIAGGRDDKGVILESAELYDPPTAKFALTGNMTDSREFHTATLLGPGPLAGMVLIAGGQDNNLVDQGSAELYDAAAGSFIATTGNMTEPRQHHTASLLSNGNVLIAGGFGTSDALQSAEIFQPATQSFAATGVMSDQRVFHAAAALKSGEVLVAGGVDDGAFVVPSADLFESTTGTFSNAGNMTDAREEFTATLLTDGTVLIAGGQNNSGGVVATAELFTP
jgi:Galactose oxidase, central domain